MVERGRHDEENTKGERMIGAGENGEKRKKGKAEGGEEKRGKRKWKGEIVEKGKWPKGMIKRKESEDKNSRGEGVRGGGVYEPISGS